MIRNIFASILATLLCTAVSVQAQTGDDDRDAFIEANTIAVFYHELGHALIDLLLLPVFGQEEDAADVLSVIMVDEIFEPEVAVDINVSAAITFLVEDERRAGLGYDVPFWDTHGPDLQRFFNITCLVFGGDPAGRRDIAVDFDLPDDRAAGCEEEYALAFDSWGGVIDGLRDASDGTEWASFNGDRPKDGTVNRLAFDAVKTEVEYLNENFLSETKLSVFVEECGEANAFYIPDEKAIVMCSEFSGYLNDLYDAIE
ncbi:MAG: hypothetical protein ACI875_002621 [Planctomycetota bacterium]|jgi:hypothetical protein